MEATIKDFVLATALGIEAAAGLLVGLLTYVQKTRAAALERVRLYFGRWLTLALEFELGADILRTAISPTWNEIGQLAAIIFLRTFAELLPAKGHRVRDRTRRTAGLAI